MDSYKISFLTTNGLLLFLAIYFSILIFIPFLAPELKPEFFSYNVWIYSVIGIAIFFWSLYIINLLFHLKIIRNLIVKLNDVEKMKKAKRLFVNMSIIGLILCSISCFLIVFLGITFNQINIFNQWPIGFILLILIIFGAYLMYLSYGNYIFLIWP